MSDIDNIAQLSYEEARDELAALVDKMQSGQMPLDLTVHLYERGEALVQHCEALLLDATQRIQGDEESVRDEDEDEPF